MKQQNHSSTAEIMGMMGYHVSDANSYLVITGGGVDDVRIVKKSWIFWWQKYSSISISPFDFEITLQAMTIEKLKFSLPAVFTIGPDDSREALTKYAKILTGREEDNRRQATETGRNHVQDIVKGIIEGETRVIVSGMTMEEIFKERQVFKTKVIENVQSELNQFGLRIYNANVKELQDTQGSEYFQFLSRKAHEGASNQAKVDVANARMIGEIGEAEKRGKTRQEISKIDAQTAVLETQRKSEKAQADAQLTTTQTKLNMGINLANIQATRQAEAKDAELQREVETKRAEMELERRRATDLVNAKIEKESAAQKAEAKFFTDTKGADGLLYKQRQDTEGKAYSDSKGADVLLYKQKQDTEAKAYSDTKGADVLLYKQKQDVEASTYRATKEAEANAFRVNKSAEAEANSFRITRKAEAEANAFRVTKEAEANAFRVTKEAEASFFRATKEAEAQLIAKKKEAEALTEMAKAYGQLSNVLGGPQGLLQYMMLKDNTYEKLAKANAAAINGLQPKITVWNTGADAGSSDSTAPIRNLLQSLPPLLSTINEQTGIAPPSWLANMGPAEKQQALSLTEGKGKATSNGHYSGN